MTTELPPERRRGGGDSYGNFSFAGLGLPTRLAFAVAIAAAVWAMVLGVIQG